MRRRFFFLILSFLLNEKTLSQDKINLPVAFSKPISEELKPFSSPSKGQMESLLKGDVISEVKVDSPSDKEQQMMLFVSGVHPRNCTRAMRKLSLYENYSQYMDFFKESKYDEQNQKISFIVDHTLLPYAMTVKFKIPRIKEEGHYPFLFEEGILKDLKGIIIVKEIGKFCLLGFKSDWRGPATKMPNIVFSTFLQTVGKLGLEHLIRVSLF